MCSQVSMGLIVAVIISIIQSGYALRCWTCNEKFDVTCGDYFNKTRIMENKRYIDSIVNENSERQPVRNDPHLNICDEMYTSNYGYNNENVCLKLAVKDNYGRLIVRRECRLVPETLKKGECPEDVKKDNNAVVYCGTCKTDGCNTATVIKTNGFLAGIISALLALFLRA